MKCIENPTPYLKYVSEIVLRSDDFHAYSL